MVGVPAVWEFLIHIPWKHLCGARIWLTSEPHQTFLWKPRLAAYKTLIKQFQPPEDKHDDVFTDWNHNLQWLQKAVMDSNAVPQEKGVLLVSIYIRLAGRVGSRCRSDHITPLVEKCLATNTQKGTQEATIECILGWAMSEADGDKPEGIVSAVLERLNSKQPKVVAGTVSALHALISEFGVRAINIKPILKALPQIFAHADKGVRKETGMMRRCRKRPATLGCLFLLSSLNIFR
ncbi:hypothetical protein PCANC_08099 [Puccinia coronata f. sp. avenae]|uniref:TOG domain-containing protein n=1 Tax=Puccinia coronata f. sp. avenae TaxID=200324 RepID=A0A2N5V3Q0_9BASI|nr:hypothetical protein PCANC_08099 [Puccinia coronata f. sp. avenae]